MKTDAEFSQRLEKLRHALPRTPGFVNSVMQALPDRPSESPWWGLALAAILMMGLAAGLVALLWPTSSVAFADVAATVRAVHTLCAQGKEYRNGQWFSFSIIARDDAERCDFDVPEDCGSPRGFIDGWVNNYTSGEHLDLSKQRRIAFHWTVKPQDYNYIQWLKEFASHDGQPLGERVVDGRKLIGFHGKASVPCDPPIARASVEGDVWVDPATKLPVRIEFYKDGDKKPSYIVDNIQFDVAVDDQTFSTTPPAGYKVVKMIGLPQDKLRPVATEEEAAKLRITPGQGVGAARVDMSRAQIEAALGPAEEVEFYKQDGAVELFYYSRGFRVLTKAPKNGPPSARFECFREDYLDQFCHSFPGRTTENVALGANHRQVEAAYGAEEKIKLDSPFEGAMTLSYSSRGINFALYDDKVVFITVYAPGKK